MLVDDPLDSWIGSKDIDVSMQYKAYLVT